MILSIAGRPEYVSPEMMRLQPYNEQTDMFSLGLVIFECLFQRHPLYAETIPEV